MLHCHTVMLLSDYCRTMSDWLDAWALSYAVGHVIALSYLRLIVGRGRSLQMMVGCIYGVPAFMNASQPSLPAHSPTPNSSAYTHVVSHNQLQGFSKVQGSTGPTSDSVCPTAYRV